MIKQISGELAEARIAARFAEAKARHAESVRERAEEQALVAMKKAKDAQVLVRQTITRDSIAQAQDERQREQIEGELEKVQAQLAEKDREIAELKKHLATQLANLEDAEKALGTAGATAARPLRIAWAMCAAMAALLVGHAVRAFVPPVQELLADAASQLLAMGTAKVVGTVGGAGAVLVLLVIWFAGFKGKGAWVTATALLGAVCAGVGGLFLP
jgi:hypothetical protein